MGRSIGRAIAVALAIAGLAGCVPLLPHTYYRPVATGGSNPQNPCWKTYEEVRFVRGEIAISVRITPRDGTPAFVEVTLQLPEGHHAQVAGADVSIVEASGARRATRFDGVAPVQMIAGERLPIGTRLEGSTFVAGSARVPRNYWFYAPIDLSGREAFTIALPAIDVDGTRIVLPDVRFTRTTDLQPFAPLQC